MNYSDILRFRISSLNDKEFTLEELLFRDPEMTDLEHKKFVNGSRSSMSHMIYENKEIQIVSKRRHPKGYWINTMKVICLKPIRTRGAFEAKKERKKASSVWQEVYPDLFTVPAYLLKFTKKRIHSVPY